MKILVTGAAGFIGSHFVEELATFLLAKRVPHSIIGSDNFGYRGRKENLDGVWHPEYDSFSFRYVNLKNLADVQSIIDDDVTHLVHFAACPSVDRSISSGISFVDDNILSTVNILEVLKNRPNLKRMVYISTSEVYGTANTEYMDEQHAMNPCSPYAASKCSADRLCYAYSQTAGIPVVIVRPFNNYGPRQYPEAIIPRFICYSLYRNFCQTNMLTCPHRFELRNHEHKRDFLYVKDNVRGIREILFSERKDLNGQAFNLCTGVATSMGDIIGKLDTILKSKNIVTNYDQATDRPGDVQVHRGTFLKTNSIFNWTPIMNIDDGLEETVKWFMDNEQWWLPIMEKYI